MVFAYEKMRVNDTMLCWEATLTITRPNSARGYINL